MADFSPAEAARLLAANAERVYASSGRAIKQEARP